MRFDLALGLANEAEALGVGTKPREHADAEAARVPKWREPARATAELLDACGAPGEVIAFLARGVGEQLAGFGRASEQRLAVIERLRGDLAGVVDAHERRAAAAFVARQPGLGEVRGRRGAGGGWRRADRPKALIYGGDQAVRPMEGGRHGGSI